ncbi:hypothetical protein LNKW23_23830 [Paralimibaculum aggregatum]|uniref:Uncharacterized protein n=1 Tax=Paralimibaculum aggregatum TaxID=3036245 RepID=A0ABQ6LQW6_9RHOB|nr:hypothetical protein LNKW23_23830 [Limibaculum sp. NKW23]
MAAREPGNPVPLSSTAAPSPAPWLGAIGTRTILRSSRSGLPPAVMLPIRPSLPAPRPSPTSGGYRPDIPAPAGLAGGGLGSEAATATRQAERGAAPLREAGSHGRERAPLIPASALQMNVGPRARPP